MLKNLSIEIHNQTHNVTMNRYTLIQYICNHELDFVAFAMTPFHLVGIKAYLQYLHENGYEKVKGILLISRHKKNGYILRSNEIKFEKFCEATVGYYDDAHENIETKVKLIHEIFGGIKRKRKEKGKKALYLIHQAVPRIYLCIECIGKTNYFVHNVVTDDGISSHFGMLHWAKMTARDNDSIFMGIKYIILRMTGQAIQKCYSIPITNFSFFSPQRLFDKKIIEMYKKVLENENLQCGIMEKEKYILYLSQPIDDVYTQKALLNIANAVLSYYKGKNYKIYVKLHPREQQLGLTDDMDVVYLDKHLSVESIIANTVNKPDYIIGWSSTSLLTLSAFWDINCYSLYKNLTAKYQKKVSADFIRLVNNPSIKNVYVKDLTLEAIRNDINR